MAIGAAASGSISTKPGKPLREERLRPRPRPLRTRVPAAMALRISRPSSRRPQPSATSARPSSRSLQAGNTTTICRKCYVHREVLNCYLEGALAETLVPEDPQGAARRHRGSKPRRGGDTRPPADAARRFRFESGSPPIWGALLSRRLQHDLHATVLLISERLTELGTVLERSGVGYGDGRRRRPRPTQRVQERSR